MTISPDSKHLAKSCGIKCNFVQNGFGRWVNREWLPYVTGLFPYKIYLPWHMKRECVKVDPVKNRHSLFFFSFFCFLAGSVEISNQFINFHYRPSFISFILFFITRYRNRNRKRKLSNTGRYFVDIWWFCQSKIFKFP